MLRTDASLAAHGWAASPIDAAFLPGPRDVPDDALAPTRRDRPILPVCWVGMHALPLLLVSPLTIGLGTRLGLDRAAGLTHAAIALLLPLRHCHICADEAARRRRRAEGRLAEPR